MSRFYCDVFGLERRESDEEFVALVKDQFELVLLRTEMSRREGTTDGSRPEPRENTAIKPVFFVNESIHEIRSRVITSGGGFKPTDKEWEFSGHRVCDGWDPEGNIFQVRSMQSG